MGKNNILALRKLTSTDGEKDSEMKLFKKNEKLRS